ncbi:hypothetical protein ACMFMF_009976 [Clarireedia jacksonii]
METTGSKSSKSVWERVSRRWLPPIRQNKWFVHIGIDFRETAAISVLKTIFIGVRAFFLSLCGKTSTQKVRTSFLPFAFGYAEAIENTSSTVGENIRLSSGLVAAAEHTILTPEQRLNFFCLAT